MITIIKFSLIYIICVYGKSIFSKPTHLDFMVRNELAKQHLSYLSRIVIKKPNFEGNKLEMNCKPNKQKRRESKKIEKSYERDRERKRDRERR